VYAVRFKMLYVDHPAFCGANLATNGCLNLAGLAVRPVATHRTNPVDFKVAQRVDGTRNAAKSNSSLG
jgi:hypothetical protein